VQVPMKGADPDAKLEISPLFAANLDQLKARKLPVKQITAGQSLYLE
jgi:hypothetical protein